MPLSRHRKLKPDAMPAFTMLSEAFLTKNSTTATSAIVASTCQKMSRTLRSRNLRRSAFIVLTPSSLRAPPPQAGEEEEDQTPPPSYGGGSRRPEGAHWNGGVNKRPPL